MTPRSSLFRPCIDLHDGQVKQIVGGTLSEKLPESLKTNFVATYAHNMQTLRSHSSTYIGHRQSAGAFARLYKQHGLEGGHVIKLGLGNDEAALEALSSWPGSTTLASLVNSWIEINTQIAFK